MMVPSKAVERLFEVVGVRDRVMTFDLAPHEPTGPLRLL